MKWKTPPGLSIAFSPVNAAYFALWPANAPRNRQQVLKVAGQRDMDSWLRETYGSAFGLKKGHSK